MSARSFFGTPREEFEVGEEQRDADERWRPISTAPVDVVVETKIDDDAGERNVQKLIRHSDLWWFPDKSMYVYYAPTHWRRGSL